MVEYLTGKMSKSKIPHDMVENILKSDTFML